ncbi:MAG: hypothetical protein HKN68_15335 [Saprospiraceae bacterium]|nr:hypothetical protein [Saprospiraceae bacterium]
MKQKYLVVLMAILYIALIQSCKDSSQTNDDTVESDGEAMFKAVEMPSILANGDPFPTDSNTINGWLKEKSVVDGLETDPNVIGHAWGLWQALTELTDQTYQGRNLRRYETWYTPQDVMKASSENSTLSDLKRTDGSLQFRPKFSIGHDAELEPTAGDISGKVKYSPGMAQRALEGNYFDSTFLKSKIVEGQINSLRFNPEDVMLKPIYRVLTDLNKVEGKDDTYYFHIWGGKQDGGKPDSLFSNKVNVCTNNASPDIDNSSTFSIDAFIYHKMSAAEAYTYNNSTKEGNEFVDTAKAGDPVILLGMHVSTRETQRWTWQSFYWTESPDNPIFPSSTVIAAGRNTLSKPLESPANHYAASVGYSMMSPALPYEGPPIDIMNAGVSPVYALNPYIEGTFGTDVFPDQATYFSGAYAEQFYKANIDGITSNCMSCHSQAAYDGSGFNEGSFLADQYVNRNAPWFEGMVQLDFAWSLFPGFEPPPSKVTE